jgi:segregation and condensation protein B
MADDRRTSDVASSSADSLSLHDFADPDDQGISLNELGRAYAALLSKGADPYPQGEPAAKSPNDSLPSPDNDEELSDLGEITCETTPKAILEAILFVGHPAQDPLASERIAALMRGVRPGEIDELVAELNSEYHAEGAPYTIVSEGLGHRLTLRSEFAALSDVFHGRIREARLSQSAIDVLAIVAYQQPIEMPEIDRLRGKPSGAVVSQLVRRDLLRIERRAEKGSRPLYRTTDRFLDLFDLDSLGELPRSQELEREL